MSSRTAPQLREQDTEGDEGRQPDPRGDFQPIVGFGFGRAARWRIEHAKLAAEAAGFALDGRRYGFTALTP
jgi:hypothetical protein